MLGFPMDSRFPCPWLILDEQDREQAAHTVKSRCKLCAKAESWFTRGFSCLLSPAWHLVLLNSLILLILRDSGEYESHSSRLDSSNQIRNGTILKAQNLQEIPDWDEIFVLNLSKAN